MTKPSEVTVTNGEIDAFVAERWRAVESGKLGYDAFRQALAAFLAARVPGALIGDEHTGPQAAAKFAAHNACRDKVVKGV